MTDPSPRFVASPDVVFTKLDATEAVLLDLTTQCYYSLNETGITVWELLTEPHTLSEVVVALTSHYEVDAKTARSFADSFLSDLSHDGLVRER